MLFGAYKPVITVNNAKAVPKKLPQHADNRQNTGHKLFMSAFFF